MATLLIFRYLASLESFLTNVVVYVKNHCVLSLWQIIYVQTTCRKLCDSSDMLVEFFNRRSNCQLCSVAPGNCLEITQFGLGVLTQLRLETRGRPLLVPFLFYATARRVFFGSWCRCLITCRPHTCPNLPATSCVSQQKQKSQWGFQRPS